MGKSEKNRAARGSHKNAQELHDDKHFLSCLQARGLPAQRITGIAPPRAHKTPGQAALRSFAADNREITPTARRGLSSEGGRNPEKRA